MLLLEAPARAGIDRVYDALVGELSEECASVLGFLPTVRWVALPAQGYRMGRPSVGVTDDRMPERSFGELLSAGAQTLCVLPACFDFGIEQKQWLTDLVHKTRRAHPEAVVHYDAMSSDHPLLVQALVDGACRALGEMLPRSPSELGLLLVACGAGDANTRADSYRVMRLVWEQIGASRGEVAFVRHPLLPLPEQLAACARSGLRWLCLPQFLWESEQLEYARVIFADSVGQLGVSGWHLGNALGDHPNLKGWLKTRLLELYRSQRSQREARVRSVKYRQTEPGRVYGVGHSAPFSSAEQPTLAARFGGTCLARVHSSEELGQLFGELGVGGERCLVKPTWHGYATGTYTDAAALDLLLRALPCPALCIESHTASRNSQSPGFDWEHEAQHHRGWIKAEEQAYFEKTGIQDTLRRHRASYLNLTECWWDGQCADPALVRAVLDEKGVALHFEELLGYVPVALFEQRGSPLLSFARFKGPTRLGLSNLFGLLPQPLRAAWHGPNITYFARVCCDLAKLYGGLFQLFGVVESLSYAVRWDRQGLYRSRWGNYDLIDSPGVVCISKGLAAADVIAARLQGQDVTRSAFFDVVRAELGFDEALAALPLPEELRRRFV